MPTIRSTSVPKEIDYPTSDGRPLAETDIHRKNMVALIETLDAHFADEPLYYVSGNLLMYYEEGNKHKHLSPDVLVSRGIPKGNRDYYLVWKEGKGPDLVIEVSSRSTRKEDLDKKFRLYSDVLMVREYYLFDPLGEYLKPPLQGYRLSHGKYVRIRKVNGRLPSEVLELHLEQDRCELRLVDPTTEKRIFTLQERIEEAEVIQRQEKAARRQAEEENERLRRELEILRQQLPPES